MFTIKLILVLCFTFCFVCHSQINCPKVNASEVSCWASTIQSLIIPQINDKTQTLAKLQDNYNQLNASIANLILQIQGLMKRNDDLSSTISQLTQTVNALNATLTATVKSVSNMSSEVRTTDIYASAIHLGKRWLFRTEGPQILVIRDVLTPRDSRAALWPGRYVDL